MRSWHLRTCDPRDGLFEICPPAIEQMLGSSVSQAKGHIASAKTEAGLTVPRSVLRWAFASTMTQTCRRSKLCRTCQGCCRMQPLESVRCLDGRWSRTEYFTDVEGRPRFLKVCCEAPSLSRAEPHCGAGLWRGSWCPKKRSTIRKGEGGRYGVTERVELANTQVGIYFLASNATVNNHLMKKLSPRVCFGSVDLTETSF